MVGRYWGQAGTEKVGSLSRAKKGHKLLESLLMENLKLSGGTKPPGVTERSLLPAVEGAIVFSPREALCAVASLHLSSHHRQGGRCRCPLLKHGSAGLPPESWDPQLLWMKLDP